MSFKIDLLQQIIKDVPRYIRSRNIDHRQFSIASDFVSDSYYISFDIGKIHIKNLLMTREEVEDNLMEVIKTRLDGFLQMIPKKGSPLSSVFDILARVVENENSTRHIGSKEFKLIYMQNGSLALHGGPGSLVNWVLSPDEWRSEGLPSLVRATERIKYYIDQYKDAFNLAPDNVRRGVIMTGTTIAGDIVEYWCDSPDTAREKAVGLDLSDVTIRFLETTS